MKSVILEENIDMPHWPQHGGGPQPGPLGELAETLVAKVTKSGKAIRVSRSGVMGMQYGNNTFATFRNALSRVASREGHKSHLYKSQRFSDDYLFWMTEK